MSNPFILVSQNAAAQATAGGVSTVSQQICVPERRLIRPPLEISHGVQTRSMVLKKAACDVSTGSSSSEAKAS